MLLPKQKMQIVTSYDGKTSEEGWLVIELSKIETEGVSRLYIDLADVDDLQIRKEKQAELAKEISDLFSIDDLEE